MARYSVTVIALVVLCITATALSTNFTKKDIFYFSQTPLSWFEARDACKAANLSLVSLETQEKDEELYNLLHSKGTEGFVDNTTILGQSWISATEIQEGVWHWDSLKKPVYHTRWFIGQPDDTENLNCVYVATGNKASLAWRDANCSAAMQFICEGPRPDPGDGDNSASGLIPAPVMAVGVLMVIRSLFSS